VEDHLIAHAAGRYNCDELGHLQRRLLIASTIRDQKQVTQQQQCCARYYLEDNILSGILRVSYLSIFKILFTARRSYASAVLGVVILSVCPSVCHTRSLCLIQTTYRRYFFIAHERTILLVFCHPTVVGGQRPLSTENVRSK